MYSVFLGLTILGMMGMERGRGAREDDLDFRRSYVVQKGYWWYMMMITYMSQYGSRISLGSINIINGWHFWSVVFWPWCDYIISSLSKCVRMDFFSFESSAIKWSTWCDDGDGDGSFGRCFLMKQFKQLKAGLLLLLLLLLMLPFTLSPYQYYIHTTYI